MVTWWPARPDRTSGPVQVTPRSPSVYPLVTPRSPSGNPRSPSVYPRVTPRSPLGHPQGITRSSPGLPQVTPRSPSVFYFIYFNLVLPFSYCLQAVTEIKDRRRKRKDALHDLGIYVNIFLYPFPAASLERLQFRHITNM